MASTQRVALTCTLTYKSGSNIVPIANTNVTIVLRSNGSPATIWNAVSGGSAYGSNSISTDATGNLNGSTYTYFLVEGSYIIQVAGTGSYAAFNVYYEAVHGDGIGNLAPALLAADVTLNSSGALVVNTVLGGQIPITGSQSAIFSPGDLKPSAVPTAPTGWLLCNGAAVGRTTYSALFAAIGTAYGVGNGTTTFNVPNIIGRAPIGAGTSTAYNGSTWTLGETPSGSSVAGGEETHTLATSEMPSHTHGITDLGHSHSITDLGHEHGLGGYVPNSPYIWNPSRVTAGTTSGNYYPNTNDAGFSYTSTTTINGTGITGTNSSGTNISINYTPAGTYHNIMQPVTVVNWFIKT